MISCVQSSVQSFCDSVYIYFNIICMDRIALQETFWEIYCCTIDKIANNGNKNGYEYLIQCLKTYLEIMWGCSLTSCKLSNYICHVRFWNICNANTFIWENQKYFKNMICSGICPEIQHIRLKPTKLCNRYISTGFKWVAGYHHSTVVPEWLII